MVLCDITNVPRKQSDVGEGISFKVRAGCLRPCAGHPRRLLGCRCRRPRPPSSCPPAAHAHALRRRVAAQPPHEPTLNAAAAYVALLLSNAAGQPTKGLANGTAATFHSLTFEGETPAEYADALERGGFHEIVLDAPPLSVNIVPGLPPRKDNYGIESLVPGALE